jgi:hypothetical protein
MLSVITLNAIMQSAMAPPINLECLFLASLSSQSNALNKARAFLKGAPSRVGSRPYPTNIRPSGITCQEQTR